MNGVGFTGEFKLVRKATGYEKEPTPHRHRVRRLREPTFPALFDRISDPPIPLTRLIFRTPVFLVVALCLTEASQGSLQNEASI